MNFPCLLPTKVRTPPWVDERSRQWISPPTSPSGTTGAGLIWGWAQAWWDSLEIFRINKDCWDEVKVSFLWSSNPKHSAKSMCYNLQGLMFLKGWRKCRNHRDRSKHRERMLTDFTRQNIWKASADLKPKINHFWSITLHKRKQIWQII